MRWQNLCCIPPNHLISRLKLIWLKGSGMSDVGETQTETIRPDFDSAKR
jgi:hypothetical protein